MEGWREYAFVDFLEKGQLSYGIVQPGGHVTDDSVPILRTANVKNGIVNFENILHVASSIENKYSKTRLQGGELLITVVGNVGECAIAPNSVRGWNVARAICVARVMNCFDIKFISYLFSTEDAKFQIYGNTNDTVQPTLNLAQLKSIKFFAPSLKEQQAIAAVLSSLDDKIDLLHRQNKTLEAMAQTLFRQWFVEEADEPTQEILLKSLCIKIESGGTPKRDIPEYWNGEIPWLTSGEVRESFIIKTKEKITPLGTNDSAAKLWGAGTIIVAMYGATAGAVCYTLIPLTANQACCGIMPKPEYSAFLYFFLLRNSEVMAEQATGSAQQNLNKGMIENIFIPEPETEKAKLFQGIAGNYLTRMGKNFWQISVLAKLRDTLLPKLMSGEVRVLCN